MGWLASAIDSESNTKRCFWKTLRNANLNYDESHTVLVEVEGTLNSRPLTYVSSDDDPEEPLTPRHLMYGRRILSLPDRKSTSLNCPYSVVRRSPKKTEVPGIATGTLLEALEQRLCYRVKEHASAEIQA